MSDEEDYSPQFNPEESGYGGPPIMEMSDVRDKALEVFDRMANSVAGADDAPPGLLPIPHLDIEHRRQFLSVEETALIVKEHAAMVDDEFYGIGGDTPEEAMQNANKLVSALVDRIMSNVIHYGANAGLIEVGFDSEHDKFCFAVSNKGHAIIDDYKKRFGDQCAE